MRTPKPSFRTAPRPSLVLIAASAFLAACGKSDVPRGLVVSPPGHASGYVYYAPTGSVYLLDESLSNYGDPADHPELLDISGGRQVPGDVAPKEIARFRDLGYVPEDSDHNPSSDLMHSNAIAYNAELDQIVLSGRFFSEIWIIDHGTTTEEARGHTGGRWGQGGDLLYRWGKPDVYGRGSEGDQTLFGQHDIRWVPEGMPGAGNLTVFNNDDVAPGGDLLGCLRVRATDRRFGTVRPGGRRGVWSGRRGLELHRA